MRGTGTKWWITTPWNEICVSKKKKKKNRKWCQNQCGSIFFTQGKFPLSWIDNQGTPWSSCSFFLTHYLETIHSSNRNIVHNWWRYIWDKTRKGVWDVLTRTKFLFKKVNEFCRVCIDLNTGRDPLKKPLDQARGLELVYRSNHGVLRNRNNPEGKFHLYQTTQNQEPH